MMIMGSGVLCWLLTSEMNIDRRFRLVATAYVARFFIESLQLPNVNRKKNPLRRTENKRMKNEASD